MTTTDTKIHESSRILPSGQYAVSIVTGHPGYPDRRIVQVSSIPNVDGMDPAELRRSLRRGWLEIIADGETVVNPTPAHYDLGRVAEWPTGRPPLAIDAGAGWTLTAEDTDELIRFAREHVDGLDVARVAADDAAARAGLDRMLDTVRNRETVSARLTDDLLGDLEASADVLNRLAVGFRSLAVALLAARHAAQIVHVTYRHAVLDDVHRLRALEVDDVERRDVTFVRGDTTVRLEWWQILAVEISNGMTAADEEDRTDDEL